MCTLIVGNQIPGPGSVVVAANRDEDPARSSDPPGVLRDSPRLVGGRDRRAGGTWLAIRERRAIVAMLNRRESGTPRSSEAPPRSRGLLALELAAVPDPEPGRPEALAEAVLEALHRALAAARYAPFSLAFISPAACRVVSHDGGARERAMDLTPGWHVLTHADLDDPDEGRTAWLLRDLDRFRPRTLEEAEHGLFERLARHATPATGAAARPAVCIHEGRMRTVSSSVVSLSRLEARYRHIEGPPCQGKPVDHSALLAGAPAGVEGT